ncbi:haloacid dehalogenase, type II [Rhizobium sp. AC27/96]|uniref:haloacid dehalogenase type II n=1 Tax=Rhizobium sp. AC27/96 TaxID=1841653 RepID=UPI0008276910|nr:haloacid dehalogenase type II [Rhizobium sp. AC27/96]OCI99155.1 haloacid dehalogenase, type II [Rhizobium sp. AC27/96]
MQASSKRTIDGREIKAVVFDAYGTLYDVQSVEGAVEAAFPGRGSLITAIWRMKQLEYSWLVTLMERYEDFWSITLRSLEYTLRSLDLSAGGQLLEDVAASYLDLKPYDDVLECLGRLAACQRVILSNGSPEMLSTLATKSGLDTALDHILSVDEKRAFKPAPAAYMRVEEGLGISRGQVAFVSSNGFDICGAKSFGFTVISVARTIADSPRVPLAGTGLDERFFFSLMRGKAETLDNAADITVHSLAEIPDLLTSRKADG